VTTASREAAGAVYLLRHADGFARREVDRGGEHIQVGALLGRDVLSDDPDDLVVDAGAELELELP
jgi:hypothetical protein